MSNKPLSKCCNSPMTWHAFGEYYRCDNCDKNYNKAWVMYISEPYKPTPKELEEMGFHVNHDSGYSWWGNNGGIFYNTYPENYWSIFERKYTFVPQCKEDIETLAKLFPKR